MSGWLISGRAALPQGELPCPALDLLPQGMPASFARRVQGLGPSRH